MVLLVLDLHRMQGLRDKGWRRWRFRQIISHTSSRRGWRGRRACQSRRGQAWWGVGQYGGGLLAGRREKASDWGGGRGALQRCLQKKKTWQISLLFIISSPGPHGTQTHQVQRQGQPRISPSPGKTLCFSFRCLETSHLRDRATFLFHNSLVLKVCNPLKLCRWQVYAHIYLLQIWSK